MSGGGLVRRTAHSLEVLAAAALRRSPTRRTQSAGGRPLSRSSGARGRASPRSFPPTRGPRNPTLRTAAAAFETRPARRSRSLRCPSHDRASASAPPPAPSTDTALPCPQAPGGRLARVRVLPVESSDGRCRLRPSSPPGGVTKIENGTERMMQCTQEWWHPSHRPAPSPGAPDFRTPLGGTPRVTASPTLASD